MNRLVVVLITIFTLAIASHAHGNILIDFDHLPDGSPTVDKTLIGDSYAVWGIHFRSIGVSDSPEFSNKLSDDMYARGWHCTYPPGFNIIVDLDILLYAVAVDVASAQGETITMIAKDNTGTIIDSVVSAPMPSAYTFIGPLVLNTDIPISTIEWWPSYDHAGIGLDNLNLIPEPATLLLLGLGGLALRRKCRAK